MKRLLFIVAILFIVIPPAFSQTYSTLPPSVVGQPAVAIQQHGNSPQVYQYNAPITMQPSAPAPSTNYVYDAGSGSSSLQIQNNGMTIIYPLNPTSK